jgi:hypothetical protein
MYHSKFEDGVGCKNILQNTSLQIIKFSAFWSFMRLNLLSC